MPGSWRRVVVAGIGAAIMVGSCSPQGGRQTYLGSQAIQLQELTPAEVAQAVQIVRRPDKLLYRAPMISVSELVDLRRAGPTIGTQMGRVQMGRSGFLQGVRSLPSGEMAHYAMYTSEYVEGKNRYVSVRRANGEALHFTTTVRPDPCVPECFAVFETLVIDFPDEVLRATPDEGQRLQVTLDNGFTFPITAPAAYVRGYLQAVDSTPR